MTTPNWENAEEEEEEEEEEDEEDEEEEDEEEEEEVGRYGNDFSSPSDYRLSLYMSSWHSATTYSFRTIVLYSKWLRYVLWFVGCRYITLNVPV